MFMVLEDHLLEFKWRMFYVLWFSLLHALLLAYYMDDLLYLFSSSFQRNLIFTSPSESFFCQIEIGFFFTLFLSIPFFVFQLWNFFRPGCHAFEVLFLRFLFLLSLLGYLLSFFLTVFFLFPTALEFLLRFEVAPQLLYLPQMQDLFNFFFRILWTSFFFFQTPLIPLLAFQFGSLTSSHCIRFRRYFVVLSFTLAALFSPPDLGSQLLLAFPLLFLYESQILIILYLEQKLLLRSFTDLELKKGE